MPYWRTCQPPWRDRSGSDRPAEVDDLIVFHKSLPFETPPDETSNTVKYRYLKGEGQER